MHTHRLSRHRFLILGFRGGFGCGQACALRLHFVSEHVANDGVDTRALQHYLGHRNIMHTVRYTELRSDRFDGFWKD